MESKATLTQWLPLVGVVIGAVFGVVGVVIGAGLTYLREREFQRLKDKKDSAHLVAIVAGALENFSAGCEAVAFDEGAYGDRDYRTTQTSTPLFEPDKLQVEWKALSPDLMFQILDLPYRVQEAKRIIDGASEHAAMPPDFEEFFEQRQYQFAVLGADAGRLAARLRQYAGVPPRPENPHWNSIEQMDWVKKKIEQHWDKRSQAPLELPRQD